MTRRSTEYKISRATQLSTTVPSFDIRTRTRHDALCHRAIAANDPTETVLPILPARTRRVSCLASVNFLAVIIDDHVARPMSASSAGLPGITLTCLADGQDRMPCRSLGPWR